MKIKTDRNFSNLTLLEKQLAFDLSTSFINSLTLKIGLILKISPCYHQ